MSLPLAMSDGVKVILVMLVVGCIFLGVVLLGELTHWAGHRREQRRRARRAIY
jgi:hypothetical protein